MKVSMRGEFEARLANDKSRRGDNLMWDERGAWELYSCGWQDGVKCWIEVQPKNDEIARLRSENEVLQKVGTDFLRDMERLVASADLLKEAMRLAKIGQPLTLTDQLSTRFREALARPPRGDES